MARCNCIFRAGSRACMCTISAGSEPLYSAARGAMPMERSTRLRGCAFAIPRQSLGKHDGNLGQALALCRVWLSLI
eukprot:6912389-Prymnesium_polylepis.1